MAGEIGFPKEHPKVAMDVPDGWAVTYTPSGLQIVSPEKNAVIFANLLPRKKADADDWAIKAETRLGSFGVSFVKGAGSQAKTASAEPDPANSKAAKAEDTKTNTAKTEPTKTEPTKSDAMKSEAKDEPAKTAPADSAKADPAKAEPPAADQTKADASNPEMQAGKMAAANAPVPGAAKLDRSAPTFTFMNPPIKIETPEAPEPAPAAAYFGTPSLGTPTRTAAPTAVRTDVPQSGTLEELTRPPVIRPKIPFAVGRLPAATMDGQPVDVQIVNYAVSQSQLFLMIQASGPSDDRAVAILQSVKPAT